MKYYKIENEIDKLLSSNGLNSYERKLLRKIKEKFSKMNHKLKENTLIIIKEINENNRQFVDLYMKDHEIEELNAKIKRMNHYFILNVTFFVIMVIGILMK